MNQLFTLPELSVKVRCQDVEVTILNPLRTFKRYKRKSFQEIMKTIFYRNYWYNSTTLHFIVLLWSSWTPFSIHFWIFDISSM